MRLTSSLPRQLAVTAALLIASWSLPASAQVRPRIMIAFDTSGSMGLDFGGTTTFGDGVTTGCTTTAVGQCGTNCTAGIDTNCDGLANDSRIFIAKNAVADMVRAYGEVDWAFSRFQQIQGANSTCRRAQDMECFPPPPDCVGGACGPFISSFGNPRCNTGASCGYDWTSTIPAACRPAANTIRWRTGGDPSVCTNYGGTCGSGAGAAQRSGDILVGFPDLGPWAGRDNTYGIIRWLDGVETNFLNTTAVGDFCTHTGAGNCELRYDGATPLAGLLYSTFDYINPIRTADAARTCRPYSVILITDGAESCSGTPNAAAAALRAAGVDVYVVGLAIAGGSQALLNAIATAGGTDAGAAGGDTAYFANDRFALSAGLAEIVRRSLRFETCNNLDDDCDTLIDEGVRNACNTCGAVPSEACDRVDNDCDTRTDEGVSNACGTCGVLTEVCNGIDDNCTGGIDEGGVCTCPAPSPEICDNADNDCDTRIDEGITVPCGVDTGECSVGTQTCAAGVFSACTGVGPVAESCDTRDNDCDGVVDGLTRPCPTGSSVGACRPGVQTCPVGGSGAFGVCTGGVGPVPEICDNVDNNCNGSTDEGDPGGGGACGSAAGVCRPGRITCVGGGLTCVGGTSGGPEACNNLDDDCDGRTDEGIATMGPCGIDTGECSPGVMACVAGAFVCTGATGPIPERCNGLDDNCDGMTDEGNPEGGASCGSTIPECRPGTTMCVGGMLRCDGAIGPTDEVCDGRDNDCDTAIDEDLGLGEACGTDTGECVPGFNECVGGMVVCNGAIGPEAEICDALDNNCDGMVDEGLGLGEPCGVMEGLCEPGRQMCVDGRPICVGGIGMMPEVCDCDDNDCDGMTDEPPPGGSLCPSGATCVDCQCALPCVEGEFGDECPTGRVPQRTGAMCFCVAERCNATTCGAETIRNSDGDVQCAPGMDGVPVCVCRSNACTFACDGVVCTDGTVCDPEDGRCVEDSCRALGCPTGEICNFGTGSCESDPCVTAGCRADQVCRAGTCETSCADVSCATGERCVRGMCVTDRCAGSSCTGTEVCNPATGMCVGSMCAGVMCGPNTSCDFLTGACVPSACNGVVCPAEQVCRNGDCFSTALPDAGPMTPDAGIDAGEDRPRGITRGLASGGGMCSVNMASRGGNGWLLAGLALLGIVLSRRSRGARAVTGHAFRAALAVSMASALGGCAVDPFCFTCGEENLDAGPDAAIVSPDAWRMTYDTNTVDVGQDAWAPDGCTIGAPELCNGRDEDCDERIDEGIDITTDEDNCGGCGIVCAPPGAFGACVDSMCTITSCDVGRFDRNMDVTDGCETRCLPTAADDTLCDLRDNDCDFNVDEDVDTTTDVANCGRCGRTCRFSRATASCVASACTLSACEENFYDLDGVASNGCEYACTPTGAETCNGRDDNCNGMVDEGNPEGGGACGTAVGACELGAEMCVAGRLTCVGGVSAAPELCNGIDDDCNGAVDQDNPEGGRSCGIAIGACVAGRETCQMGALACVGAVVPRAELCNGLDDNCDGAIDDGNPGGGAACGIDTGECTAGALTCSGGAIQCVGEVRAGVEACNTRDDDCDSRTDEDFALSTNVNNCGSCGRVCNFANALEVCTAGSCAIAACETGFVNLNGTLADGCEYACVVRGSEICNGRDDDCDGSVDNGLTPPTNFCNLNGVCAGTTAACSGATGWRCTYTSPNYQATETRCDGRDNDCDGSIDEPFAPTINPSTGMGTSCFVGVGACRRNGTNQCTSLTTVGCSATMAGAATAEVCNNIDDNCDGTVDNNILSTAIPTVTIPRTGGGTVRVMRYEASRPDATSTAQGNVTARACSNENVLPWTNVNWTDARAACCALNATGTCAGDGTGWRLCDASDWTAACRGPAPSTCTWSYSGGAPACATSAVNSCNGEEFDSAAAAGDQDALYTTGSPTFPACYATWGGAATDRIYDMSGNAREWTATETSAGSGFYFMRGGSYNNIEPGRTCSFDFAAAAPTFAFTNTGFRCCFY
jgi:hypothetical protein